MKVDAVVRQFNTRGGAFVNVHNSIGGGIGLWGNTYGKPTFLMLEGNTWVIVTFEDRSWVDEELPKLIAAHKPEAVFVLPTMKEWEG